MKLPKMLKSMIDHGNNIRTVYAHLDKIFVVKGQEITTTKHVIARMGSTGWFTLSSSQ